jgi:exodeoxyribonuclease VII large subunit
MKSGKLSLNFAAKMSDALTLLDLNVLVKNRLRRDFPDTFWIQAEISECKEHYSGHCYLELVQKKERSDAICAKSRATIWSNTWIPLKQRFEQQTGTRLQPGQKILTEVSIEFHELYGFSLLIRDIDPAYTLGDVSLRRQEVIRKLTEEGVIDLNKELEWPILPKQIAVVSSPSAAGYEDFMDQLRRNPYGFKFSTHFFPAVMQGEAAGESIRQAMDIILASDLTLDAVVIIRGGGATTDLQCFDQYELCFYAAQYPLPLLTGIGHDRDSSVLDRVACVSVKTPTAAAEYLVDCMAKEAYRLDANLDRLIQLTNQKMDAFKRHLQVQSERLRRSTTEGLNRAALSVERYQAELLRRTNQYLLVRKQDTEVKSTHLNHRVRTLLEQQHHRLELLQTRLESHSPELMIRKGFSLTLHQGKIIKSVSELESGAEIQTRLNDGTIYSTVFKNEKA